MAHLRLAVVAIASATAATVLSGCSTPPPVAPAPPPVPPMDSRPLPAAAERAAEPVTVRLHGGCEGAKIAYAKQCAANPETCPEPDPSRRPGADVYGAVLNRGTYLAACGVPPTMAVKICAAVRDGRAIAVTVATSPGNEGVGRCIGGAVQALSFPSSPGLDITSTVFAAP